MQARTTYDSDTNADLTDISAVTGGYAAYSGRQRPASAKAICRMASILPHALESAFRVGLRRTLGVFGSGCSSMQLHRRQLKFIRCKS